MIIKIIVAVFLLKAVLCIPVEWQAQTQQLQDDPETIAVSPPWSQQVPVNDDGSPNVGFSWAMTRARDDEQSDPTTGDVWSQAHQINLGPENTPPVIMLDGPMGQTTIQIEQDQNRPVRMCAAPFAQDELLRLKRFDANEQVDESQVGNAADQTLYVAAPEPTKILHHHGHGHGHNHDHHDNHDNHHNHGHNHGHFKSADENSGIMTNGQPAVVGQEWKHNPKQLTNQDVQAILNAVSSQLGQQNPMVGQEWKHRPQPAHLSEEMASQLGQQNPMVGQEWKHRPQPAHLSEEMASQLGQQNPMVGQEWKHRPQPAHLSEEMASQLGQQNPMVGQEWKHRPQPAHLSEDNEQAVDALVSQFEQMTGRSGSTMDQAVAMQNPMLGQEWKHRPQPAHLSEEMASQLSQQNPMVGQEWKHRPQPAHLTEEMVSQLSQQNPMVGQEWKHQPQPAHLSEEMASQLGQQNPMVGQEWKHRPQPVHVSELGQQNPMVGQEWKHRPQPAHLSEEMASQLGQQNPMLGQEWKNRPQPNHFTVNDNSGTSMLGAATPTASDVLSAGNHQMLNLQTLNAGQTTEMNANNGDELDQRARTKFIVDDHPHYDDHPSYQSYQPYDDHPHYQAYDAPSYDAPHHSDYGHDNYHHDDYHHLEPLFKHDLFDLKPFKLFNHHKLIIEAPEVDYESDYNPHNPDYDHHSDYAPPHHSDYAPAPAPSPQPYHDYRQANPETDAALSQSLQVPPTPTPTQPMVPDQAFNQQQQPMPFPSGQPNFPPMNNQFQFQMTPQQSMQQLQHLQQMQQMQQMQQQQQMQQLQQFQQMPPMNLGANPFQPINDNRHEPLAVQESSPSSIPEHALTLESDTFTSSSHIKTHPISDTSDSIVGATFVDKLNEFGDKLLNDALSPYDGKEKIVDFLEPSPYYYLPAEKSSY